MLQGRLPAGWAASIQAPPRPAPFDGVLRIRRDGPDGTVRVGGKSRVEPRDVDHLAATLRPTPDEPVLIAAPYLSPRTQERLRSFGFAFADLTGNVRLELTEPGLFIETTGAQENPEPSPRDHIDPAFVRADIEAIRTDTELAHNYVEQTIAHRTWKEPETITFEQFNAAVDALTPIFKRYYARLTGGSLMQMVPVPQYNTHEPFTFPWDVTCDRIWQEVRGRERLPWTEIRGVYEGDPIDEEN